MKMMMEIPRSRWARVVKRWLNNEGREKSCRYENCGSNSVGPPRRVRYYVERGSVVRETLEYLDPETFARERGISPYPRKTEEE